MICFFLFLLFHVLLVSQCSSVAVADELARTETEMMHVFEGFLKNPLEVEGVVTKIENIYALSARKFQRGDPVEMERIRDELDRLRDIYIGKIRKEKFTPTDEERLAALKIQSVVSEHWGYQARQQRNLRAFAMGGSNTRFYHYRSAIIKDFANMTSHPQWNASFFRVGFAGIDATRLIGIRFPFEDWNFTLWPNVIMLELSNNIVTWKSSSAGNYVDMITRIVRSKYSLKNLTEPDIMFLELFNARELMTDLKEHPNSTLEHKQNVLKTVVCSEDTGHFCSNYLAVRKVATFYGYPMVSWREFALNAFIRYYLCNTTQYGVDWWSYTPDGSHFSYTGGALFYDTLLGPFLHKVMQPRNEPVWDGQRLVNTSNARLYPPTSVSLDLIKSVKQGKTLSSSVQPPVLWQPWNFHKEDYLCSRNNSHSITLDIDIPQECNNTKTCSISVGFLHSWNTSQIGHVLCRLYDSQSLLLKQLLINGTLNEQGKLMRHTLAVRTNFPVIRDGVYSLRCDKLDDKQTCLTSFSAQNSVEI